MRKSVLTDEDKKRAQELRDAGVSYREIGRIFGVCHATIRRNLNPKAQQYADDYYKAHRAERKQYNADYYKDHAEEAKRVAGEYYKEHKEEKLQYEAEYYKNNKEKIRQHNADYYKEHAEEEKQYSANYRKTHKEEIRKWSHDYYESHKPEINQRPPGHSANHRALRKGALIDLTEEERNKIKEIYLMARTSPRVRCYLCKHLIPIGHRHVDHIVPISKGGKHEPSNLAIACDKCNLRKSDKMPDEIGLLI